MARAVSVPILTAQVSLLFPPHALSCAQHLGLLQVVLRGSLRLHGTIHLRGRGSTRLSYVYMAIQMRIGSDRAICFITLDNTRTPSIHLNCYFHTAHTFRQSTKLPAPHDCDHSHSHRQSLLAITLSSVDVPTNRRTIRIFPTTFHTSTSSLMIPMPSSTQQPKFLSRYMMHSTRSRARKSTKLVAGPHHHHGTVNHPLRHQQHPCCREHLD